MKEIDKIRSMSVEELASFLTIYGITSEMDEDAEGNYYSYETGCWYTPYGEFPGWYSKEDVIQAVTIHLTSEEKILDN